MADKIQTLLVSLEARINQYESTMRKALATTNSTARKVESRFAAMNKAVTTNFGTLAAGFVGVAALRGAQELIDASTRIENSLKIAGLEGEQLKRVYDDLFISAQKNAAPLEALVDLYGRASLVQKELGVSTEELLGFTDKVAVALRVSGKSAQESSGALLQLSQALGSGVVRAEEFNSILEGALPIAQAAAAGLEEAGGSVAKLRALVVDGKISSEAFFRAFEAGSSILTDKVATAELTVSQGFIRLQNVLIDTAGKFDDATGASGLAGGALDDLATAIENIGSYMEKNKPRINGFFEALGDGFGNLEKWRDDFRDAIGLTAPGGLDDFLEGTSLIEGTFGFASQQIKKSADEISASMLQVLTSATGLEDQPALEGLVADLSDGTIGAAELQEAIIKLGGTPLHINDVGELAKLIEQLRTARAEAEALAAAPAADGVVLQRAEQKLLKPKVVPKVKTVSLDDYKPPAGGGSKTKTPAQKFDDELAAQERRNANLREETALQATLNPLVNDYGYAVEKLKVQQELENAATAAGLELTPDRKKAIADLAQGYAAATVEAAKLSEAQDKASKSMEDWFALGKDATRGFIDDLVAGKSAAEALGGVFEKLADKLLDIGLDSLFGTGKGDFGIIGKLLGFASGTANTGGTRGQPRGIVHGQEAVIPLPNGGKVPVDVKMPTDMSGSSGGAIQVSVSVGVENGELVPLIAQVSGEVSGRQIEQRTPQIVKRVAPGAVRIAQRDRTY